MRAFVAKGEERKRLFNVRATQAPVVEYQGRTTRQLPVVVLERIG